MKKFIIFQFLFSLLISVWLLPSAQAAPPAENPFPLHYNKDIIIPTTPVPGPSSQPVTMIDLMHILAAIGNFLIVVAPIVLVIALIASALWYMSAGDNPDRLTRAKAWLKYAIIGGFIVFGAGVIINTIAIIVSRQFFCQAGVNLNIFGLNFNQCFLK